MVSGLFRLIRHAQIVKRQEHIMLGTVGVLSWEEVLRLVVVFTNKESLAVWVQGDMSDVVHKVWKVEEIDLSRVYVSNTDLVTFMRK